MAKFYESTASIKKEAGKKKKKETPQKASPSSNGLSKQGQETVNRLSNKYAGGGSGGSVNRSGGNNSRLSTKRNETVDRLSNKYAGGRTRTAVSTPAENKNLTSKRNETVSRLSNKYAGGGSGGSISKALEPVKGSTRRYQGSRNPRILDTANEGRIVTPKKDDEQKHPDPRTGVERSMNPHMQDTPGAKGTEIVANTGKVSVEGAKQAGIGHLKTMSDINRASDSNILGSKIDIKSQEFQEDIAERKKASSAAEDKAFKALSEIQERSERKTAKIKENATGFEKTLYNAAESGAGMATDIGVGALTGTGQVGALASMASRTYGTTRGQAQKEGATESEDRIYSLLQAGKEVGTELMFPGVGLAKGYAKKGGISVAEKLANKATQSTRSKLGKDIVGGAVRWLGGIGEENAEEFAGWLADPFLKDFAYGKAVRERTKASLSDGLPQITSPEQAQAVAAKLNSDEFIDSLEASYIENGMKEKDAKELAEMMRDYYAAYYSGDEDEIERLGNDIAEKVHGKSRTWNLKELGETFAATTLLTAATGAPGSIKAASVGAQYREMLGTDGLRQAAETLLNYSDDQTARKRAENTIRAIDEGREPYSTSVADLMGDISATKTGFDEKVTAANNLKAQRDEEEGLTGTKTPVNLAKGISVDMPGEATSATYEYSVNNAAEYAEAYNKRVPEEDKISEQRANAVADTVGRFEIGEMDTGDIDTLRNSNKAEREIFKNATGIDLDQYNVTDKKGNVDVVKSNEAMADALLAQSVENYVTASRTETAVWRDSARGEVVENTTRHMEPAGTAAVQQVLKGIDERDRTNYTMTAAAASYVYSAARNGGLEFKGKVRDTLTSMYPSVSETTIEQMYEAGLEDRRKAMDVARDKQVRIGEAMSSLDTSEPAPMRGNFYNETGGEIGGEEFDLWSGIARMFNVDIHLTADIAKSAGIKEEDVGTGKGVTHGGYSKAGVVYLNAANDMNRNMGYVFMHEFTHHLRTFAPVEYQILEDTVRARWQEKDPGGFERAIERMRKTYPDPDMTDSDILEEIIANSAHEFLQDQEFAERIAADNPTFAKAVLDAIRDILRKLRALFVDVDIENDIVYDTIFSYLDMLEEGETLWLNMYTKALENRAAVGIATWERNAFKFRKSMTENQSQTDADYMAAVEAGDMETAQRMVDEAAERAGYDTRLYHGTDEFGFTEVDVNVPDADGYSFWAASREDMSATYTKYGKERPINSEISEADQEELAEATSEKMEDAISDFKDIFDDIFGEWTLGPDGNSYLRDMVDRANPEVGEGDGVYDALNELIGGTFYELRDDLEDDYDGDFGEWLENSPEGQALYEAVYNIEGIKSRMADIDAGNISGGIYGIYANTDNMYEMDANEAHWDELRPEGLPKLSRYGRTDVPYKTRDVADWAHKNGYDGVIFRNIRDNGKYGRTAPGDVYTFFNPQQQVKSADPVTYDDNGNVIPLSERFNRSNQGMRWSVTPYTDSEGNQITAEQHEVLTDIGPNVKLKFSRTTDVKSQPKAQFKNGTFMGYSHEESGRQIRERLIEDAYGVGSEKARQINDGINSFMDVAFNYLQDDSENGLKMKYEFIGWDDLENASISVFRDKDDNIQGVTLSAMKKNGEYPINFDLSTVCNKRVAFTRVIEELMKAEDAETGNNILTEIKLSDKNMWKINDALREEGIDTACLGCFVESRRYHTENFYNAINEKWNNAVRRARRQLGLPEEVYFDFANGKEITGEIWSVGQGNWQAYEESDAEKSSPGARINALMDEIVKSGDVDSPYLKLIRQTDLFTPEGMEGFKNISTPKHDMVGMIKSIYGTSAPKEIIGFTPYNSEIALLPTEIKGEDLGDYLKGIGGIRIQSFSDFMIEHIYDHFQMVADMAARMLPAHAYTKVIAFAKLFGLTGEKINMSVMFDVATNAQWSRWLDIPKKKAGKFAKKYQGMRFVAELPDNYKEAYNNADKDEKLKKKYDKYIEQGYSEEDARRKTADWAVRPYKPVTLADKEGYLTYLVSDADYAQEEFQRLYDQYISEGMSPKEAERKANSEKPFEQSINYREAKELQDQDGYRENVGIIAVAYGDEHLKMLLDDENVRYVIPYHKSGLPKFISQKTNLKTARDYTKFQNTYQVTKWKFGKTQGFDIKEEYEKFKKEHPDEKRPAAAFFGHLVEMNVTTENGEKYTGTGDFDVYGPLETANDIRDVAEKYLEHCIKNSLRPVFYESAAHPNYYKVLFDFMVADDEGNIYPQHAVRNNYPGIDVDAIAEAGETVKDEDLEELKAVIDEGAKTQNDKLRRWNDRKENVMNDLLSTETKNSIIAGTNVNSVRYGTEDYTNPKTGTGFPEGAMLSVTPQQDADYMAAVERGDMETAQRMVDEAAERAGYTEELFHGTEREFNSFDINQARFGNSGYGIYLGDESRASEYSRNDEPLHVYAKTNNLASRDDHKITPKVFQSAIAMLDIDPKKTYKRYGGTAKEYVTDRNVDDWRIAYDLQYWASMADTFGKHVTKQKTKAEILSILQDTLGYDGMIKEHDETVLWDNTLVKLADPITYDDDGNVIPLSERFDQGNQDIRWSVTTTQPTETDSTGSELSPGQIEYFKNSKARDEQGRLVPVYHTTNKAGFTVFDTDRSKDDRSIFFSDSYYVSQTYAEDAFVDAAEFYDGEPEAGYYKVYLNLENPLIIDARGKNWDNISNTDLGIVDRRWEMFTEDRTQMLAYSDDGGEETVMSLKDPAGYEKAKAMLGSELLDKLETQWFQDDYGTISTKWDTVSDTMGQASTTRDIAEYAHENGYDGVIIRNVVDVGKHHFNGKYHGEGKVATDYIAFSSEQIKDVRNKDPHNVPDIRWSVTPEDMDAARAMQHETYMDAFNSEELEYLESIYDAAINDSDAEAINLLSKASKWDGDKIDAFYNSLITTDVEPTADDKMSEEGIRRISTARNEFLASTSDKWNDRWLTKGEVLKIGSVKRQVRELVKAQFRNSKSDRQYRSDMLSKVLVDCRLAYMMAKRGRTDVAETILWASARDMIDGVVYYDEAGYDEYSAIKNYCKTHKVNVPFGNENDLEGGLSQFRKHNVGRIRLVREGGANPEDFWGEMKSYAGESTFNKYFRDAEGELNESDNPADYLNAISAFLDAYKPYEYALTSDEAAEQAMSIASDLGDIVFGEGESIQSLADKYKTKYDAKTKALKVRLESANKKTKQDLETKYKQQIKDLKAQHRQNLKDAKQAVREQEREKANARTKKLKETQREKLTEARKKAFKAGIKKSENRAHKRELVKRIEKTYNDLARRTLNPSKEKYVPEEFRAALAETLASIDLQSWRSVKREEKTGEVSQKVLKLRALQQALENLAKNKNTGDDIWIIDENLADWCKQLADRYEGKEMRKMSLADLETFDKALRGVQHAIIRHGKVRKAGKIEESRAIGAQTVKDLKRRSKRKGKAKTYKGPRGAAKKISMSTLTPGSFFERLGAFNGMYEELRHEGFDTYIRNEAEIIDGMTKILGKYYKHGKIRKKRPKPGSEIEEWRSSKSAVTLDLTYGSITMTVAQRMEFYELVKRGKQAIGHMTDVNKGGIICTPIQPGGKIERAKEYVKGVETNSEDALPLTEADIQTIIQSLTEEQIQVADGLQQLLVMMGKKGNIAHRELYGYEIFDEENYYRIRTKETDHPVDVNTIEQAQNQIKSWGSAKALTPGAKNTIIIDDIFTSVADQCNQMNLYASYLVPLTDFMNVYNAKVPYSEDGDEEHARWTTVQGAIEETYGKQALHYINKFVSDINGIKGMDRSGAESILDSMLSKAKATAVGANISVAFQQPTAIVKAMAEIGLKYFLPGRGIKSLRFNVYDEMKKYCPIALWKSWGYYDTYMSRDLENVMMNNWTRRDLLFFGAYGSLDMLAWSGIWQAVKAEQADKYPDMDHKSEEFLQICGRRASEVYDRTQVVDSTFTRSDAMRSKDTGMKIAGAFMSEPILTLDMLKSAWFRASELAADGKKGEAFALKCRTVSVVVLQAAVVAGARALADTWRGKDPGLPWDDDDDDDEEAQNEWYVRVAHNYIYDLIGQLHLEDNIIFFKDIHPIIRYMITQAVGYEDAEGIARTAFTLLRWDEDYLFKNGSLLTQNLYNLADGITMLCKKLDDGEDSSTEWYDIFQKIGTGLGPFTGIPLGTIMRDFKPIRDWLFPDVLAAEMLPESIDTSDYLPKKEGEAAKKDKEKGKSSDAKGEKSEGDSGGGESGDDESTYQRRTGVGLSTKKSLFGLGKSDWDKYADQMEDERKARNSRASEIRAKTQGLSGKEKDKKIWDAVSSEMEKQTGASLTEIIEAGDYQTLRQYRSMYMLAGGDMDMFDARIVKNTKTALKKSIVDNPSDQQIIAQASMRAYLRSHGMTAADVSDVVYRTEAKTDLQVAMRINDEEAIETELAKLSQAGITQEDIDKAYKYRRRVDLKKYKANDGKYADKLKSTGQYEWPISGSITSRYTGNKVRTDVNTGRPHTGLDIAAASGTPVGAADGGTVVYAGWYSGAGKTVMIEHDDGTVTQYSHLSWYDAHVGDTVGQGETIGNVGSTGNSTGPHLHFAVKVNGSYEDPLDYLSAR